MKYDFFDNFGTRLCISQANSDEPVQQQLDGVQPERPAGVEPPPRPRPQWEHDHRSTAFSNKPSLDLLDSQGIHLYNLKDYGKNTENIISLKWDVQHYYLGAFLHWFKLLIDFQKKNLSSA